MAESTLCSMNDFFRRFLRYNLRQDPIIYRLIEAALIGNVLMILSYISFLSVVAPGH